MPLEGEGILEQLLEVWIFRFEADCSYFNPLILVPPSGLIARVTVRWYSGSKVKSCLYDVQKPIIVTEIVQKGGG